MLGRSVLRELLLSTSIEISVNQLGFVFLLLIGRSMPTLNHNPPSSISNMEGNKMTLENFLKNHFTLNLRVFNFIVYILSTWLVHPLDNTTYVLVNKKLCRFQYSYSWQMIVNFWRTFRFIRMGMCQILNPLLVRRTVRL